MRRARRILCALALSGLLALVYFGYSDTLEGSGAGSGGRAVGREESPGGGVQSGAGVGAPETDCGPARTRGEASRPRSEWPVRGKDGEAREGKRRGPAVGSRELQDRKRRPRLRAPLPAPSADPPVELDRVSTAPGALSAAVTGVDWGAPRPLVLWRIQGEQHARLSTTRSRPDRSFDFGQVLVPDRGLELVVTVRGAAPGPADRARSLELQRSEVEFSTPE